MTETRKLAAILVADVVGYSRLAGADEERTLARLRALRSDLIAFQWVATISIPTFANVVAKPRNVRFVSGHRGEVTRLVNCATQLFRKLPARLASVVALVSCEIHMIEGLLGRRTRGPTEGGSSVDPNNRAKR
jgi:hypothetical protein